MERVIHKLTYPYMTDPMAMNSLRGGTWVDILDEKQITIGRSSFTASEPLRVGERAFLFARSFHVELEYESDRNAFINWQTQDREQKQAQEQEKQRLLTQKRIEESQQFYSQHQIPFSFSIEIKEVLSGLTEGSMGNGVKRNTVFHVFVTADFNEGRFHRKKDQYLCTDSDSKWGANWSGSLGRNLYLIEGKHNRIPTCKQCLRILERFENQ